MHANVHAKLATQIQVLVQLSYAQVIFFHERFLSSKLFFYLFYFQPLDSCVVNNGGCGANAICSHDSTTNACKCTCKTGYTNTGSDPSVVCTGIMLPSRRQSKLGHEKICITISLQTRAKWTTADVMPTPCVHMILRPMHANAPAKPVTQIQALNPSSHVKVILLTNMNMLKKRINFFP